MQLRGSNHKRYMWLFKFRGEPYSLGPVGPMTKKEVVKYLRLFWGNGKRIPYGTRYWKI